MSRKNFNQMTDEEFRDCLKYTKEGKQMVTQIAKDYTELKRQKQPRWINEIPKPNVIGEKRELTEEEKKEAEEFEKAVRENRISEWFNKKR